MHCASGHTYCPPHRRESLCNAGAANGYQFTARSRDAQTVGLEDYQEGGLLAVAVRVDQARVGRAMVSAPTGC
jgi:hypothetical protein